MIPQEAPPDRRRKVLVTGASGMLGWHLVPVLEGQGWEVIRVARTGPVTHAIDLCDAAGTGQLIANVAPSVVVHLAAATDVDMCERDPQLAYRQNVLASENVALACAQAGNGIRLVHASTDHVYDGAGLHAEDDVTVRNHYAMSKLAGEQAALRCPGATILRLNFAGRSAHPKRRSFSDWVVESLKANAAIQVFDDVWFSPLRVATLARALAHVAAHPAPGVFNLGSVGQLTKAELAQRLARGLKLAGGRLVAAPLAGRTGMAPRPLGMGMDCTRFARAFSFPLPPIDDEVQALLQEYMDDL
jgi:dTDP-4-dehydrorhamnose reductase